MMHIPVSKYHGCGNDFILLKEEALSTLPSLKIPAFVRSVCSRHTGIGADGCILVKKNPLTMIYYNQDGSRADMCGNGIRCFGAFCLDENIVSSSSFDVCTLAGMRTLKVLDQGTERIFQVEMGKPVFDNEKIGVFQKEPLWNWPLSVEVDGNAVTFNLYSFYMNTIHTVVFVDEDPFDPKFEKIGQAICMHPLFTKQTNVNFVQILKDGLAKAATYERGCGPTLACGTGMCAAGAASWLCRKSGPHLRTQMRAGVLDIDISDDQSVCLSGPARRIMKGIYDYDEKTPS